MFIVGLEDDCLPHARCQIKGPPSPTRLDLRIAFAVPTTASRSLLSLWLPADDAKCGAGAELVAVGLNRHGDAGSGVCDAG